MVPGVLSDNNSNKKEKKSKKSNGDPEKKVKKH